MRLPTTTASPTSAAIPAMASDGSGFDMSEGFGPQRPSFHIGQHDSTREAPLTDLQYGHLLNHGVSRQPTCPSLTQ